MQDYIPIIIKKLRIIELFSGVIPVIILDLGTYEEESDEHNSSTVHSRYLPQNHLPSQRAESDLDNSTLDVEGNRNKN